jgi:GT2 family glycosyltransferase
VADPVVAGLASTIVICTKDRTYELRRCLATLERRAGRRPILVNDASVDDATEKLCGEFSTLSEMNLTYARSRRAGLARQRNEAIDLLDSHGVEVVHFIDDDTEVLDGYFDAIEDRFTSSRMMGIGGVIVDQPPVHWIGIKRLFLLASDRPGAVLRSGRVTIGQYPSAGPDDRVDWISGCSMSYRWSAFRELRFDDELVSYSLGEDRDFSARLGVRSGLAIEPKARIFHHRSELNRKSRRELARQRTVTIHRWVLARPELGFRRVPFWWSVLGDFLLRATYGVAKRDRDMLAESAGVLAGVWAVVAGGS